MTAQTSIRTFLCRAKDALQHGIKTKGKLTFVIGNESAGTQCPYETIHLMLID